MQWRDRALEVAQLRQQLRAVPVHDHAAWSVATEPTPGRLAAAAAGANGPRDPAAHVLENYCDAAPTGVA